MHTNNTKSRTERSTKFNYTPQTHVHTRTTKITVIKQHNTNSALKIFFEKMGFEVCFEGGKSLAVTD